MRAIPATAAGTATVKAEKWKRNPIPNADYNSVAISGDGSKVVAGTFFFNDGSTLPTQTVGMFGWDSTGADLWPATLPGGDTFLVTALPGKRAGVESVSISKDGAYAACCGLISAGQGFIYVYDAAGNKTSLFTPLSVVTSVALSSDGTYLVAGADVLYVFKRTGSTWSAPQTTSDPSGMVRRVAISDDGQWIAAAIDGGWASLVRNQMGSGGAVTAAGKWKIPKDPTKPQKFVQEVAVSADGSSFSAAGADGKTYYFDIAAFQSGGGPLAPRWAFNPPGESACRWVAMADDGQLVSAVFSFGGGPGISTKGKVYLLNNVKNPGPGNPLFTRLWTGDKHTTHGPNCVSMATDSTSQLYITVADGIPKKPTKPAEGGFYLLDGSTGNALWGTAPDYNYPTLDMNYAVAISADGSAVAGASNDGYVYYFVVP
jgi:WD40 repeat protein